MDNNSFKRGESGSVAAQNMITDAAMIATTSSLSAGSEMGSKRRKGFVPRKNSQLSASAWDDNGVPFFDEQE